MNGNHNRQWKRFEGVEELKRRCLEAIAVTHRGFKQGNIGTCRKVAQAAFQQHSATAIGLRKFQTCQHAIHQRWAQQVMGTVLHGQDRQRAVGHRQYRLVSHVVLPSRSGIHYGVGLKYRKVNMCHI